MLARTATRKALSARIAAPTRRLLTTEAKPKKRNTWKGTALRWGLAGAGIYYYNTNDIFAEQEQHAIDRLEQSIHNVQQSELPTIDAIVAEKRARAAARAAEGNRRAQAEKIAAEVAEAAVTNAEDSVAPIALIVADTAEPVVEAASRHGAEEAEGASIEDLEAEAGQQGAFNPETGEINWDCPCLGGMAHGPCGPDFREAFSCFVYSKEEPKGMECIDKFKGMQDCFRAHPEMYGSELEDDEEYVEAQLREEEDAKAAARVDISQDEAYFSAASAASELSHEASSAPKDDAAAAPTPANPLAGDESGDLVTKAVADALEAQKK